MAFEFQLATNSALLTTLDMNTATAAQLRFMKMPFQLNVITGGTMHGIALYFDVEFSKCFKYEGFSTAPGRRYTHWAQSLFFFDGEMKILKVSYFQFHFSVFNFSYFPFSYEFFVITERPGDQRRIFI